MVQFLKHCIDFRRLQVVFDTFNLPFLQFIQVVIHWVKLILKLSKDDSTHHQIEYE